jgi:multidrug efflux pump
MQFNLSKWALENRSLVVYMMIAATIAGLAAFFRLGRDEDPPFVIKRWSCRPAGPAPPWMTPCNS